MKDSFQKCRTQIHQVENGDTTKKILIKQKEFKKNRMKKKQKQQKKINLKEIKIMEDSKKISLLDLKALEEEQDLRMNIRDPNILEKDNQKHGE